jgi:hypothetical protein
MVMKLNVFHFLCRSVVLGRVKVKSFDYSTHIKPPNEKRSGIFS